MLERLQRLEHRLKDWLHTQREKPSRLRSQVRFGFGLRTKVILIASLLLALPWVGYNYVLEMEKILRQGQEQTLIGTTRALATALNERPNLFNDQASFLQSVEKGRDLYAYDLNAPITLDGKLDDWADLDDKLMEYGRDYVQFSRQPYRASSLHFRHVVGKHDGACTPRLTSVTKNRLCDVKAPPASTVTIISHCHDHPQR
ncbi:sensor histidine kinase [Photobacterium aphoticum]|uniref:Sensor histidine kinase n=1 Tax=Photobacterium aphoticum TaxID=754436 RepID=A0A090R696_9GAMM|nr:sensor histidine kinase [Photobacterium aphoticum]